MRGEWRGRSGVHIVRWGSFIGWVQRWVHLCQSLGNNNNKYLDFSNGNIHLISRLSVVDTKFPPVQQIRQSLSSVSHNNSLSPGQLTEVKHHLSKPADTLLYWDKLPVQHVDTIRGWVSYMFLTNKVHYNLGVKILNYLNKTSKSRQIGCDWRYSHDGALCRCVAPWFIITGKYSQVASSNK